MTDSIGLTLTGLASLQARLDGLTPALAARLSPFMAGFGIELREQVKRNIADRFGSTGALYQSITVEAGVDSDGASARVFSDGVPYAAIQEYGGRTPAHDIFPVNARVLAFAAPDAGTSIGRGGFAFAMRVHHPGSTIPARPYARPALDQLRGAFEDGVRQVVNAAIGDLPSGSGA